MDRDTREALLIRLGEISTEIVSLMEDVNKIKQCIASLNLERASLLDTLKDT